MEGWLEVNKKVLAKQHHTAKRIFDWLRDKHDYLFPFIIL